MLPHTTFLALMEPMGEEEIEKAIFKMKAIKAPGVDSIHMAFYQSQWDQVEKFVHEFIQKIFNHEWRDSSINQTLLTLIPKADKLETLNQF